MVDVALQTTLREATSEKMDTHTVEIFELQEQTAAMGAKLLQPSAKHNELANE